MNDFENLKKLSRDELRDLAFKQGLQVHHKAKAETIIKQIIEFSTTPVKQDMQHVAEKPVAPVYDNTPEDIEEAIAHIKAQHPAFVSKYDIKDNTWEFSCKGAVESGNMAIPLRVIVRRAEIIRRGRLQLIGLNDHFDKTTAGGNNAYTNSVLAG